MSPKIIPRFFLCKQSFAGWGIQKLGVALLDLVSWWESWQTRLIRPAYVLALVQRHASKTRNLEYWGGWDCRARPVHPENSSKPQAGLDCVESLGDFSEKNSQVLCFQIWEGLQEKSPVASKQNPRRLWPKGHEKTPAHLIFGVQSVFSRQNIQKKSSRQAETEASARDIAVHEWKRCLGVKRWMGGTVIYLPGVNFRMCSANFRSSGGLHFWGLIPLPPKWLLTHLSCWPGMKEQVGNYVAQSFCFEPYLNE